MSSDRPILVIHARDDIDEAWHQAHIEAARAAYPAYTIASLRGYSGPVAEFADKDVTFWPWMGAPSARARLRPFAAIVARTAQRVRLIAPKAEDMHGPADLNGHDPIAYAKANIENVEPAQDHEVVDLDAEWFGTAEPEPLVSEYTPHHPDLLEEEWPDPLDIFNRMPTPELRPEHLPPELSDFIFDQSEIIGSDPGTMALAVLAACAACTHDSIKIRPKRHDRWTEEARLWCGIVGDPGVKKTPPIKRAMSHLRKIEMEWSAEDRLALPKYEIEKKRYAKLEAMAVNDPSLPIPEPPRKPPNRQLIAQDTTIEALSVALTDNPGGMLCFHDELSGFFGQMDAYRANSGKDRSFWLDAYGGGPRNINRIGRESIPVPNLSVCILGGIQPEPMRKISAKLDDDGLLQRFVLVMAKEPEKGPQDRDENRKAAYGYHCMLDFLVQMRGDDEPVRMSEDALAVREKIEEKVRRLASTDMLHARMRSHLRKWEGLFPRLCLTYHAIQCANLAIDHHAPVTADTATRVGLFLFDYLFGHLRAFYDDILGESGSISHAQWIAGHLLAHLPKQITARDIHRAYRPWRGMSDPEKRGIIATLDMSGWIRSKPERRMGSPERSWLVNPQIGEVFADRREMEVKARTAAVNSVFVKAER